MSNGDVFVDFLYEMFAYQYPKAAFVMLIGWFVYLCTRIEVIVDFLYCLNHFVIGASLVFQYYDRQNYRGWIEFGILTLWFLRLGGFIFCTRVLKGMRDARYADMKPLTGDPNKMSRRCREN